MNASTDTRRTMLVTLLVLAALGGLGAWWWHTHERVEQTIDLPRTGEARSNPLYALKVALQKDDVRVNARRRLQLPGLAPKEAAVPLAARDTVLLYNDPRTLTPGEVAALLRWVDGGGHLIVRTPPMGVLAKNSPVPLLAQLQLQAMEDRGDCESLGGDKPMVMFCGARRFTLVGANPAHSWGDLIDGYVFARVTRGKGSVDVLADLDFLGTEELKTPAHVSFVRQLLAPNYRAGTVHLVYAAQMPSLWTTLFLRSWMAWAPLLLALALWLWRRMQRFGPLQPAPASERRSLLEHIVASGEHAYRYGYAHLLHAAARNAFLARLRRRDPQAAALEGEPQLALLGERFPDVAPAELRDALATPFANDHAAFRTRIATLVRLRNRL
jgi:hypothetical protein